MLFRCLRRPVWTLAPLLLAGCLSPVREAADVAVCDLAARPVDLSVMPSGSPPQTMPPAQTNGKPPDDSGEDVQRTAAPVPAELAERLRIPPGFPGGGTQSIELPPYDPQRPAPREEAIRRAFPALPALGSDPETVPGPEGTPLTLADLQRLALTNSPLVRQAAADVEAARGAAVQAGLYPNPVFGYEGDTAGTNAGAGYQGAFFEQTIKTAGKLKLAQASAEMGVANAELALRKTRNDLAGQVRAGWFAVLLARENATVQAAVVRFTDEVYRVQLELLRTGQVAPYEVLQFRVQALQARSSLVQARNRATAAWKQLAATLGLPALPPTELAGRADGAVPAYLYDAILARVLEQHTDVLTARNAQQKARYDLRLAEVTPIPDVGTRVMLQKDYTSPTFLLVHSVVMQLPVPVFNRNQGNIQEAQAKLLRATEEAHRVRADLTARLAEAFERYENTRQVADYYRQNILPDQVRVYRGVYDRYRAGGENVNFNDVAKAQQDLATAATTYLTTLGAQWTAVVDVAGLLQTDDLFQGAPTECPAGPDLAQLLALPCCHPCSPLPDPTLKGADGTWPPAVPSGQEPAPETLPPPRPALLPPSGATLPRPRLSLD